MIFLSLLIIWACYFPSNTIYKTHMLSKSVNNKENINPIRATANVLLKYDNWMGVCEAKGCNLHFVLKHQKQNKKFKMIKSQSLENEPFCENLYPLIGSPPRDTAPRELDTREGSVTTVSGIANNPALQFRTHCYTSHPLFSWVPR